MLHQLGSGVLGPVFRAHDATLDRFLAVKAFTLDLIPEDAARLADALQRLVAVPMPEGRLVTLVEAGIEGHTPYLASECLPGETLDVAMRDRIPAAPGDVLPLLTQVAEAIDAAWAAGPGHGMLHPRDVFVLPGETLDIRLTGVGLAGALSLVGIRTPVRRPYTAPEGLAGGLVDLRADVYALGAITHELLTGRRPAGPGAQDGQFGPSVAAADRTRIQRVLATALAADPAQRWASATELVDALREAVGVAQLTLPMRAPDAETSVDSDPGPEIDVTTVLAADLPDVDRSAAEAPGDPGEADAEAEEADLDLDAIGERVAAWSASEAIVDHDLHQAWTPAAGGGAPPAGRAQSTGWGRVAVMALAGLALGAFAVRALWPAGDDLVAPMTEAVVLPGTPMDVGAADTEVDLASDPPISPAPEAAAVAPVARPDVQRATAPAGRLLVRSEPSGALVTLDDTYRGETPATLRDLTLGTYRVQVAHPGYAPEVRTITLTAAEPAQNLTVRLTAGLDPRVDVRGTLLVDSRPRGARVLVNGKPVGVTPLRLPGLAPGPHAVRLELAGYRTVTSTATVAGGTEARVAVTLEPATVGVRRR